NIDAGVNRAYGSRGVRTPGKLHAAPPFGGVPGAATPTRKPSWATHATAQRLPEHSRTLPADHLELSPYPLPSPVHCAFKTPTGLDCEPIPAIFSPGHRPEAPGRRRLYVQFFNSDHPFIIV